MLIAQAAISWPRDVVVMLESEGSCSLRCWAMSYSLDVRSRASTR